MRNHTFRAIQALRTHLAKKDREQRAAVAAYLEDPTPENKRAATAALGFDVEDEPQPDPRLSESLAAILGRKGK